MIWAAVLFGTILLLTLGAVIISFVFLYQRKKYRHNQEVTQIRENFAREMLHSKTEIQEQTLQHIASEIHDNFNPTLSVINLNLASVLPSVDEPVKETIADTKSLVKQLMAEMRALSATLNTDQLSRIGFSKALEQYTDRIRKSGFFELIITSEGEPFRLPSNKEIILFRMCQEILNNIVKHSGATQITVQNRFSLGHLQVTISDNGKGFDTRKIISETTQQDGSGLRNLRNRALAIEADLDIQSSEGQGTSINILI